MRDFMEREQLTVDQIYLLLACFDKNEMSKYFCYWRRRNLIKYNGGGKRVNALKGRLIGIKTSRPQYYSNLSIPIALQKNYQVKCTTRHSLSTPFLLDLMMDRLSSLRTGLRPSGLQFHYIMNHAEQNSTGSLDRLILLLE